MNQFYCFLLKHFTVDLNRHSASLFVVLESCFFRRWIYRINLPVIHLQVKSAEIFCFDHHDQDHRGGTQPEQAWACIFNGRSYHIPQIMSIQLSPGKARNQGCLFEIHKVKNLK